MTKKVFLGGPMFEAAKSELWESVHLKQGAHYNNYGCKDEQGMEALRSFFPEGEANELNFVLFSTSGIHGSYATIEDVEECTDSEAPIMVTFLIVQPRICCLRHGNAMLETPEDFKYLKKLRQSSWDVVQRIGRD